MPNHNPNPRRTAQNCLPHKWGEAALVHERRLRDQISKFLTPQNTPATTPPPRRKRDTGQPPLSLTALSDNSLLMNPRHATALALTISIAFSCLTSCATYTVQAMAVQNQADSVVIQSYKYGFFAPVGDEGQGLALATSICTGSGYSGAIRLGDNEQCVSHDWGIPRLFIACSETVLMGNYQCIDSTPASHLVPIAFESFR
jgi:hypothetical protein